MAQAKGLLFEANEWFKDANKINEKLFDAYSLRGNLHQQKEEWFPAQKAFEKILEIDRTVCYISYFSLIFSKDTYALLSMGNIYYKARKEKKEKEEKYLKLAHDFYWKVLQTDPR